MKPSSFSTSLLAVAGSFLLAATANAVQDTNSNGLSDVWERFYNADTLFSAGNPNHAPTADPDGDGWTNADEAIAGTDPFSTALPQGCVRTGIVQHPEAEGLFILTWPSIQGKVYKLFLSSDLVAWTSFGELIPGTNEPISLAVDALYEDGTSPERLFWRVKIEDDDPDGDTLTTWEELALGYDPYSSDTDLDGIADNIDGTPLANNAVASPDGAGLVGTTLSTNMIGRWDFESYDTVSNPPTGYLPWRYLDQTSGGHHAASFSVFPHDLGMPSKATNHAGGFVAIPRSLLNGLNSWSVSFWAAIDEDSIKNSNGQGIGLFTHHHYLPHITSGATNWGLITTKVNGIWLQKVNGREILRAGTYSYTNHSNGTPLSPPPTTVSGVTLDRPLGTADDGKWHHYVMTRSGGKTTLYIDGQQAGLSATHAFETIPNNNYSGISVGRFYGLSPDSIPVQPSNQVVAHGRFDRLRVWSDGLTTTEVGDLHHEDIDRDGLWDITEVKTRLWRDANSDATATPSEFAYVVSPFQWHPTDHDTDGDEASDLAEQAAGTDIGKADTDGDLVPDGFELAHGLNPLNPADGLLDPDTDGLSNLEEWQHNTDPHDANSDGGNSNHPDTTNDGGEVGQGSDPNDPTDGGAEPEEGDKVTIRLAVGDESGSESEDYVLHCFKIDKETGEEKRIYTLRSGGFGEFKQEDSEIFRQDESYTFQIKWQGTNNDSRSASPGVSAEGPDFDYTFRVEPQNGDGVLIDSWSSQTGTADQANPILAEEANDVADDAAEFRQNYEKKRVVLLAAETVVGEPGTEEENPGDWSVVEAYPTPAVEMSVTNSELIGSSLHVTIAGTVTDPISKFSIGSFERPQTLKFLQDGQQIHSIPLGPSVRTGFAFNETVVIPNAKPVSYLIRAETTPNVAGLIGFDQSAVSLTWHEDPSAYPTLSAPLSIYFPTAPTSGTVDQATVYVGSGNPPAGSKTVTETGADTLSFTGQLEIPSSPSPITATCAVEFTLPKIFSASEMDSIVLDFRFTAPGFPENAFYGRWVETGVNTRIFRPYGWFFGNNTLQVAFTADLPGSKTTIVEPATIRLPILPGQGSDAGGMKIVSGGVTFDLTKIDGSWYPKDPLKPGSAKLFLPSSLQVPARLSSPGYDPSTGELSFKIKLDSESETEAPSVYVLPGTPAPDLGGGGIVAKGGPPAQKNSTEPWAPGQAVQLHQLLWAYKLINADDTFALELLDGYLRGGHIIQLHDGSDLDLDVSLNDITTDTDNIWTIQIEEDWNPVYCASLLFEGLKKASVYKEVYDNYEFEDPFDDILAFKTALNAAVQQTRENAVFATQLYLSGLGIINEGNDWILVINDVSEGNYESLAGALPFVPAGLLRSGGRLIFRKGASEVLETLDEAGVDALREITRESDLRVMGTLMDEHQFGESLRRALSSNGGAIPVPTKHGELRKAMEAISPPPKGVYQAHHDFPWADRAWFAERGLDVNDPAFGRWVSKYDHSTWHSGIGMGSGGRFNNAWRTFMDAEGATPYTVSEILDKLADIRAEFPVTGGHD